VTSCLALTSLAAPLQVEEFEVTTGGGVWPTIGADGKARVHRVVCAVDCGTVVNPGIVAQQMESGIIFGLTAALYSQIEIKDGQIVQANFPDYPVIKMAETPLIETHIVPGTAEPSGVGEVAVPPIAPAVAHAVAQLTGKPVRQLPLV
ncbi:molybdopterin cofactor-binding domain-containing protein, partial [Ralstonia sp.]|uniref:molybdopterin cofactor-binding domain-containing protein n=1 Tax=Ralstonia sp. TaxID=54061 RepID=UPI0031D02CD7